MTSLALADLTLGQELPPVTIDLTRTLIVATAIASRDYQDVHHDPELARQRGSQDIFMNILTTNALAERFVTEWTGPAAVVRRIRVRLGAPNHPGDQMVMTGSVTALDAVTGVATVAVRGANSVGDHLTGVVEVRLPGAAAGGVA